MRLVVSSCTWVKARGDTKIALQPTPHPRESTSHPGAVACWSSSCWSSVLCSCSLLGCSRVKLCLGTRITLSVAPKPWCNRGSALPPEATLRAGHYCPPCSHLPGKLSAQDINLTCSLFQFGQISLRQGNVRYTMHFFPDHVLSFLPLWFLMEFSRRSFVWRLSPYSQAKFLVL